MKNFHNTRPDGTCSDGSGGPSAAPTEYEPGTPTQGPTSPPAVTNCYDVKEDAAKCNSVDNKAGDSCQFCKLFPQDPTNQGKCLGPTGAAKYLHDNHAAVCPLMTRTPSMQPTLQPTLQPNGAPKPNADRQTTKYCSSYSRKGPGTCGDYKDEQGRNCQYCKWSPADPDEEGKCLPPAGAANFLKNNPGDAYCQDATRAPTMAPTKHPSGTSKPTSNNAPNPPPTPGGFPTPQPSRATVKYCSQYSGRNNKQICLANQDAKGNECQYCSVGKATPKCLPRAKAEEFLYNNPAGQCAVETYSPTPTPTVKPPTPAPAPAKTVQPTPGGGFTSIDFTFYLDITNCSAHEWNSNTVLYGSVVKQTAVIVMAVRTLTQDNVALNMTPSPSPDDGLAQDIITGYFRVRGEALGKTDATLIAKLTSALKDGSFDSTMRSLAGSAEAPGLTHASASLGSNSTTGDTSGDDTNNNNNNPNSNSNADAENEALTISLSVTFSILFVCSIGFGYYGYVMGWYGDKKSAEKDVTGDEEAGTSDLDMYSGGLEASEQAQGENPLHHASSPDRLEKARQIDLTATSGESEPSGTNVEMTALGGATATTGSSSDGGDDGDGDVEKGQESSLDVHNPIVQAPPPPPAPRNSIMMVNSGSESDTSVGGRHRKDRFRDGDLRKTNEIDVVTMDTSAMDGSISSAAASEGEEDAASEERQAPPAPPSPPGEEAGARRMSLQHKPSHRVSVLGGEISAVMEEGTDDTLPGDMEQRMSLVAVQEDEEGTPAPPAPPVTETLEEEEEEGEEGEAQVGQISISDNP